MAPTAVAEIVVLALRGRLVSSTLAAAIPASVIVAPEILFALTGGAASPVVMARIAATTAAAGRAEPVPGPVAPFRRQPTAKEPPA